MGKNIPGLSVLSAPPVSGTGPPTAPSSNGSCVSAGISPSSRPELPGAPWGGSAAGIAFPVTLETFVGGSLSICVWGGLLTVAVGFLLVDLG